MRRPLVDLLERTMKTMRIRLGILCTAGQGQGGWRSRCGVHTPAPVLATYGMEESFPPRPAWSLTGWKKARKMNLNNLITDEVISIWNLKSGVLKFSLSCLERKWSQREWNVCWRRAWAAGPATWAFTDHRRHDEIKEQERRAEDLVSSEVSSFKKNPHN